MSNRKNLVLISLAALISLALTFGVAAQMAKPKMEQVSGVVMDLTCAAKGKVMMDSWYNAENDEHKTPDGPKPGCATMCLKGGQPAALFADGKVQAVFGCNPRATLANYASQEVDVMGFWGGGKKDSVFIPGKIRKKGASDWTDVNCDTMH